MSLIDQIDKTKVPQHIAIIMDGNGRWAKQQGENRIYGHYEGVNSVRDVVEGAGQAGVNYITLYAFSTENWNRPKDEVDALMELLVSTISMETEKLHKKNVRLQAIGNLNSLPPACLAELNESINLTSKLLMP
jgi:undecaprenyl diphosphate synthase